MAGAPHHCPELACRRARKCQGGDGPPCFRADREELREVLFLAWAKLFLDFTDEEIEDCLSSRGSRYTLPRSGEPPDGWAGGHKIAAFALRTRARASAGSPRLGLAGRWAGLIRSRNEENR
jgi:hypothetical protein